MRIKFDYRKRSNGLPILSMKEIDGIAELILSDFNVSILKEPTPVDMESLLEFYLGVGLDYQNLTHNKAILGMTVFNDCRIPVYDAYNKTVKIIPVSAKTVMIDNLLLKQHQKGRYRFTLGHEASHWILHRDKYLENKKQTCLFKVEEALPSVKCRAADIENSSWCRSITTDHDLMEWQADRMASALLMPKRTFLLAVQEILEQGGIHEEGIPGGIWDMIIRTVTSKIAEIFQVSQQAARIRFDQLGFIRDEDERQQMLF
ncbi:MAG: ImmA/IrrE family metallo-endopeptidase [Negativicutes bacterium]|nr:ImmA/IrrE family metallo-endopeptidase [Negativicutes bacterium]